MQCSATDLTFQYICCAFCSFGEDFEDFGARPRFTQTVGRTASIEERLLWVSHWEPLLWLVQP